MIDKKLLTIIVLALIIITIIVVMFLIYQKCKEDENKDKKQQPTVVVQKYKNIDDEEEEEAKNEKYEDVDKNKEVEKIENYISKEEALKKREIENMKPYKIKSENPIFKKLIKEPSFLDRIINIINQYNPMVKKSEDYEFLKIYNQAILEDLNTVEKYEVRNNRNPIVFVPAIGGTQLVSQNTDWSKFKDCSFYQKFDGTIWLGLNPNSGGTCNASIIKPIYDKTNNTVKTNSATTIKVNGKLGSFDSCNCFNDTAFCLGGLTDYAKKFKKALENVGYKENVDMFAVGYDFRLVPHLGNYKLENFEDYGKEGNHFGRFFLNMKQIIEQAYLKNKKQVYLVAHSMGGLLTNAFLNICRRVLGNITFRFDNEDITWNKWVNKCIGGFIPVGAAFDGGSKGLKSMLTGYDPGVNLGTNSYWRSIEQILMGNILLIPMIKESYRDDTMVIINNIVDPQNDEYKKVNNNIGENSSINLLLREFGLTDVLNLYKNILDIKLLALHDPKVKTFLVYSNTLDTEAGGYEYDKDEKNKINFDKIKSMYYTKGDGTVPESIQKYFKEDHNYNIDNTFKNKNWYNIVGTNLKIEKWTNVEEKIISSEHSELITKNTDVYNYIINKISS